MSAAKQHSPAWWAMRLPLIKAFAEGKRVTIRGVEDDRLEFCEDASEYQILPDPPVEFFVVLDNSRKVVALQPNFGSADTARDAKDREYTTNGVCRNVHRVAHCKEVVAETKQLPLRFTTQPKVENEADIVVRAQELIRGEADYDSRDTIKGLLSHIEEIGAMWQEAAERNREAAEAAERG